MLTTQQVAERLQVSRNHVLRLIGGGKLRAVNVGDRAKAWRISVEALDEFLRRNEVPLTVPAVPVALQRTRPHRVVTKKQEAEYERIMDELMARRKPRGRRGGVKT